MYTQHQNWVEGHQQARLEPKPATSPFHFVHFLAPLKMFVGLHISNRVTYPPPLFFSCHESKIVHPTLPGCVASCFGLCPTDKGRPPSHFRDSSPSCRCPAGAPTLCQQRQRRSSSTASISLRVLPFLRGSFSFFNAKSNASEASLRCFIFSVSTSCIRS